MRALQQAQNLGRLRLVICTLLVAVVSLLISGLSAADRDTASHSLEQANTTSGRTTPGFQLERLDVPVTNTMSTAMGFIRHSPPPWTDGNHLEFRFQKKSKPGQMDELASWTVVNMHAENFGEITRRLKLKRVEIAVCHVTNEVVHITDARGERTAINDVGWALIVDSRIPTAWFLSDPTPRQVDFQKGRRIKAAFPQWFRPKEP